MPLGVSSHAPIRCFWLIELSAALKSLSFLLLGRANCRATSILHTHLSSHAALRRYRLMRFYAVVVSRAQLSLSSHALLRPLCNYWHVQSSHAFLRRRRLLWSEGRGRIVVHSSDLSGDPDIYLLPVHTAKCHIKRCALIHRRTLSHGEIL